jgi:hypothetical protein
VNLFRTHGYPDWEHEDASQQLLDYLVDENGIDIEKEDLRFVQSLIKGEKPANLNSEKSKLSYRVKYLISQGGCMTSSLTRPTVWMSTRSTIYREILQAWV